ncbi:hypothetical protein SCB49_14045 [unidentified eubacterium SCB49]|nr:hypothetical protein SCB49_14045 [unidentified eubacterium SCB49]
MHKLLYIILLATAIAGATPQDSTVVETPAVVQYDVDQEVSPIVFDQDKIENYKNDDTFNYEENLEENWWTRFKTWIGRLWSGLIHWLFGDVQGGTFLAILIQVLPYIFLAGCIAFVVWLVIKLNPGSKILASQDAPSVFFSEEEEIIKTKDIELLIQKALQNNDYRLAVRYYYLLILKRLTESELIEYEFDKTNSEYFNEIKEVTLNENFRKATTIYDYIWYGNFEVTQEDYKKAEHQFKNLEQIIPAAHV